MRKHLCAFSAELAMAALLAVAALLAAPVAAGALEDADAAYQEKDYVKAVGLWRALAEGGNADAQYSLGTLYADGKGVAPDDAAAFQWFERAAKQGHAMAQYNLGASYATGAGVAKDDAEAARWFRRAADQGMAFAQLNLGLLYAAGIGVPQDNVEAFKWIELAFLALPAGGPRMDAARAMTDLSAKMTTEEKFEANRRQRDWKARPEGK